MQIYDFQAIPELDTALRQVDPDFWRNTTPTMSRSDEGMFLRLNQYVESGNVTFVEKPGTAAILTKPGAKAQIEMILFSPQSERSSKNIAIDRIEVSNDSVVNQSTDVRGRGISFGPNIDIASAGQTSFVVPLIGETRGVGEVSTIGSQRREMIRFGTPAENKDGLGLTGHRVRATVLIRVVGPGGTRWVVGDILFRTTETPPPEPNQEQDQDQDRETAAE